MYNFYFWFCVEQTETCRNGSYKRNLKWLWFLIQLFISLTVTYLISYRNWCVIYFDLVSNCSIPSRYHFLSSMFITSSLHLCFRPTISHHHTHLNRSLKQARVEWILKLNWVTTLLYPICPCSKSDYESAQQTISVNYLYRRFEALCQRMIANWRGTQSGRWWRYKRSWRRHVKATKFRIVR